MEEGEYYRGRSMPRPHPHACRNSTEIFRIKFHGIHKRQEQFNDIREVPGAEVQIPQPRVLVQRVLCRYGRKKCKENRRIHKAPARRRQGGRTNDDAELLRRLFTGGK